MSSTPLYFTKLELENIRSFGGRQCLDLTDSNGRPAQWTLVLGDNGLGKTTLLQCLARMRPQFNEPSDDDPGPPPSPVEPELVQEEDNAVLRSLARLGSDGSSSLRAEMVVACPFGPSKKRKRSLVTWIDIVHDGNGVIQDVDSGGEYAGKRVEPLVLAYGAGRYRGVGNLERSAALSETGSLFAAASELFDPEETLYQLDYLQLKKRQNAKRKLASLKALLAEVLPYLTRPQDIDIRGPVLPGASQEDGGVWISTPFGIVPLRSLSLGYQTVMAWTADIAWRLLNHYPESSNPLLEPAIVIVDEIDLHLHPQWQREIRRNLTSHFPAVQFIASAHSPLMAQDALETNIAVIHDNGGEAVIVSDPAVVKEWRLDQIITSELFGLQTARAPEVEAAMRRHVELAQREELSAAERKELKQLNEFVHGLPTAETADEQEAMDIIRQAAARLELHALSE